MQRRSKRLTFQSSDSRNKRFTGTFYAIRTAACGQEITLAFLDTDGFAAAGQCAGTIGNEQRHKGVFVRCTVEIPVFDVNGKILALSESELIHFFESRFLDESEVIHS